LIDSNKLYQVLDLCSVEPLVRDSVIKNHDNNLWWPLDIVDYRKRLIIAGLSTRISYNMIDKYRKVIYEIDSLSYDTFISLGEEKIKSIIKPLGLYNTRYKYITSMIDYISKTGDKIFEYDHDFFIKELSNNVIGASYKVAQCCLLYIGDYHNGIMPVDSGMKDMLLPGIGFNIKGGAIGHEIVRKDLTKLIKELDLSELIKKNNYNMLNIPCDSPLTWWAHLVLIYYKRFFCNKHQPSECKLYKANLCIGSCKKI